MQCIKKTPPKGVNINLMGRLMGIEPTSVGATIRCVNHFATIAVWCRKQDLNPQPTDYKSVALPTELTVQKQCNMIITQKIKFYNIF